MKDNVKDNLIFFLLGTLLGLVLTMAGGAIMYKVIQGQVSFSLSLPSISSLPFFSNSKSTLKSFNLSFEEGKSNPIKAVGGAESLVVSAHATSGEKSLLLNIYSGHDFPGVTWEAYGKDVLDWSAKQFLRFDLYHNSEKFVRIEIKLKSGKDYPKKTFNYSAELNPLSDNKISIPLDSVVRNCNLSEMSYFKMFVKKPQTNIVLYLDNIRLE